MASEVLDAMARRHDGIDQHLEPPRMIAVTINANAPVIPNIVAMSKSDFVLGA